MLQNDPVKLLPYHFDADPDPAFHFYADPDPAFYFDADPDPAYHKMIRIRNTGPFWFEPNLVFWFINMQIHIQVLELSSKSKKVCYFKIRL